MKACRLRRAAAVLLGAACLAAGLQAGAAAERPSLALGKGTVPFSLRENRDSPRVVLQVVRKASPSHGQTAAGCGVSGTFSIAAADPETGICGAAVASKYPAVGKVVPFVRGGVGAFCTQHWHNPDWGQRALDLLQSGRLPEEVLAELLRDDPRKGFRQLGIVDAKGRAANRNPDESGPDSRWWGAMSGRFYACQGNTLTGSDVIIAMANAYETTQGSLADRLVAALVAGDCAGGDHRGRLAAAVCVAKPGMKDYWLELRVDKSDDAVLELARKYAELQHAAKGTWAGARLPFVHPCPKRRAPQRPAP